MVSIPEYLGNGKWGEPKQVSVDASKNIIRKGLIKRSDEVAANTRNRIMESLEPREAREIELLLPHNKTKEAANEATHHNRGRIRRKSDSVIAAERQKEAEELALAREKLKGRYNLGYAGLLGAAGLAYGGKKLYDHYNE